MASSSSSPVQQKHEVFLSFRGEDTRYGFTSYLYNALRGKAIDTFIDYDLKRGDEISTALLKRIEESMISIVILSENYASSSWCLDELSKIIECKTKYGQKVVPIFYLVDPSDVRKQKGSFAEAFAKYEERLTHKVERWRAALTEVANLSGWPVQRDRPEAEYIEEIIQDISKALIPKSSNDSKGLVGIDSRVEQIESSLCFTSEGVRIVGIQGMGGIGKTTIAEVVFNRFSTKFEGSFFLPNVREESKKHELVHLREKLLSKILAERNLCISTGLLPDFIKDRLRRKKVLIVLDDVNDSRQLQLLPGKDCFGSGSRIIVTSRDRQVLKQVVDDDKIFEVKQLINKEALQLFSLNAFRQNHPMEDFVELSNRVINYAQGHPLALKVLGSSLYRKSKQDWESALNKLKKIRNPEIHDLLRISYDGLDSELKNIFLDIACFFKGDDNDSVIEILDSCYYSTSFGISVLIDKSLVTISHKNLGMHDLLQEMGWHIVCEESVEEPGKRSRLWIPEDIYHVLENNTGTAAVQAIVLDMSKIGKIHLSPTVFAKMYNLKLLIFHHSGFIKDTKVYLPQGLETLPDNVRYFQWDRYPSKSFPSKFCPEKFVTLNMPNSHVKRLWNGVQNFVNLKRLNLCYSPHLIEIPNLSQAINLERMELDCCTSLVEIPSSIRYLNKLSFLCLWHCTNLRNLPSMIHLIHLKILILSGCLNITKCPEISGNLEELYLNNTAIEEVPSQIGCLSRLNYLDLNNCKRLKTLPSSICKLKSLATLDLFACSELASFPEILEHMQSLQKLYLGETAIQELPLSIDHLDGLVELYLNNCTKLESLPRNIFMLKSLRSFGVFGISKQTMLKILGTLPSLASLAIRCLERTATNKLYLSVEYLNRFVVTISWSSNELWSFYELLNLVNLESLQDLCLSDCNLPEFPKGLTCISCLRKLDLCGNNFERIPESIKQLSALECLDLSYCKRLQFLPELPPCLQRLDAHDCTSLRAVPSLTNIRGKSNTFVFTNCLKLNQNAIWAEAQLRIRHKATEDVKLYKAGCKVSSSFTSCLPGSEIPDWFSHQNEGSSLAIPLPPNLDDSKFVGFSVCAVLAPQEYAENLSFNNRCRVGAKFKSNSQIDQHYDTEFEVSLKCFDSDHVLLSYNFDFYKTCCNNPLTEAKFNCSTSFEVKKCGVCILYAQDDPTMLTLGCFYKGTSFRPVPLPYNPRVIQPSSSPDGNFVAINRSVPCRPSGSGSGSGSGSSPCDPTWLSLKCGLINQVFIEPAAEDSAIIKRYRDDYYNEAETSGDFSSREEEGKPHPKKSKYI